MKELHIFAGPNGSGKSTLASWFLKQCNMNFVNADVYAKDNFDYIKSELIKNYAAAKFTARKREKCISKEMSFACETVLSTDRHIKFMEKAHENGYFISTYYVITESADVNISRIEKRVKQGGHDVPKDKTRARFEKCLKLMPQVVENSDFFVLFDNTKKFEVVLLKQNGKFYRVKSSNVVLDPEMEKYDYEDISIDDIKILSLAQFENCLSKSKD